MILYVFGSLGKDVAVCNVIFYFCIFGLLKGELIIGIQAR